MRSSSAVDVLVVGPIPPIQNYVGGIGTLIMTQLARWELPLSVAHFNTELWAREFGDTGRFRPRHLLAFVINGFRLSAALRRYRPAVMHFHTSIGLALVKDMLLAAWGRWIFRCKVVLHVHYGVVDAILLVRSPCMRRLQLRTLMLACDRLVFLSESVVREMAAMLPPAAAARLQAMASVLPNFTEVPLAPREIRPVGATPLIVFFIGNIGHRKGAYDLVRASARIVQQCEVPFRLVFAGPFDSPEDARCMTALVEELGLSRCVRFIGPVTGEAKTEAFRTADIFALPSYGEGVPVSLIEALAFGIPVVVSDVGGIPETVTDGLEGFLLHPGQVEVMAATLGRLIEDPELRRKMGCAGRARAEQCYSVGAYFKALHRLYSGLKLLAEVR